MAGRSCFILLLTLAGSQVAMGEPKVILEPAGIGHDATDIKMMCAFSPTTAKLLEWVVKPSEDPLLFYSQPSTYVIGPGYKDKITNNKNADTGSHSMALNQANECDAGTYTCKVTDDSNAKTSGSAILTVVRMKIDGKPFNGNVIKPQGTKVSVECFAWWESEGVEVTLSRGSADTKKSGKANKDSRDKCGFKAEARLQFDLSSKDPQTFSCEVSFGGVKETIEYTVNVGDPTQGNGDGNGNNGDGNGNNGDGNGNNGDDISEVGSAVAIQWSVLTFLGMLFTTMVATTWI